MAVDPPVSIDAPTPLVLHWERQQPGCGLRNVGNTCFLNSVLQCLAHLPPVGALAQRRHHRDRCPLVPASECAMCLLEERLARSLARGEDGDPAEAPMKIVNRLGSVFSPSLTVGRQEDAHEWLRMLLDAAEKSCLRPLPKLPPGKSHWTVLHHLFQGRLVSQVECRRCGHVSRTSDPFMDLSLELTDCRSLVDALRQFTAPEHLSGDNAYLCEKCKRRVPADKRLLLQQLPPCLVVHLKRFDCSYGGKISRHVHFPLQLPLDEFVEDPVAAEARGMMTQQAEETAASTSASASKPYANSVSSSMPSSPHGYHNHRRSSGANGGNGANGHGAACSSNGAGNAHEAPCSSGNGGASSGGNGGASSGGRDDAGGGVAGGGSPLLYQLWGVVVHQGYSAQAGHYYALVRVPDGQRANWYEMNDSIVEHRTLREVRQDPAYMLFYARMDPEQQRQRDERLAARAANEAAAASAEQLAAGGVGGGIGDGGGGVSGGFGGGGGGDGNRGAVKGLVTADEPAGPAPWLGNGVAIGPQVRLGPPNGAPQPNGEAPAPSPSPALASVPGGDGNGYDQQQRISPPTSPGQKRAAAGDTVGPSHHLYKRQRGSSGDCGGRNGLLEHGTPLGQQQQQQPGPVPSASVAAATPAAAAATPARQRQQEPEAQERDQQQEQQPGSSSGGLGCGSGASDDPYAATHPAELVCVRDQVQASLRGSAWEAAVEAAIREELSQQHEGLSQQHEELSQQQHGKAGVGAGSRRGGLGLWPMSAESREWLLATGRARVPTEVKVHAIGKLRKVFDW